ncbi:PAS domain S-box-containing protein [Methanomicrobium sp. W14]|uniref:PAS domain S-box protein n=1 Tax=Methanomicrobium sp. W14 TaxID=2817839 RepID=UPI001AE50AD1|nr:PAS domain S-box protein [Methanomicrobium sp. W14]MBP2134157.1 PAS domain S-box-containing protein [Methanomicrobium sp. W14]
MSENHPDETERSGKEEDNPDFNKRHNYTITRSALSKKNEHITAQGISALQNVHEEVYWIDKEKKIIFANKKACDNLGYLPEEIKRKKIDDIRPGERTKFSFPVLWKKLHKSGGVISYSTGHRRSDNTVYAAESCAGMMELNKKNIICIFSHKTGSEYNSECQSLQTSCSPSKNNFCILDVPNEKKCTRCTMHEILNTGESFVREKYSTDGRCLKIAGYPVYDNSGNIKGAVESVLDVTSVKETERALRESEKQYKDLFTTMTNAFALHEIITGKDGNPVDYRYLNVNPAFEKMTGLCAEKIQGKTFLEIFPRGRKEIIERYGRVAKTGKSENFSDYNPALRQYHKIHVYSPGKDQFAAIYTDITDLVELKHEQKIAIDQLNRNFEELAILNDEIRNPLQTILGYIDLGNFIYYNEVMEQIKAIDRLVNRLDKRWLESEKIRDFLRKHYNFNCEKSDMK